MENRSKTLVIQNGTLIDGSGATPVRNEAMVVQGNRIRSVGLLPGDVQLRDRTNVDVVDASGRWIHCAGRVIITYGSIEDDEPSWVGTPDHGVGVSTHAINDGNVVNLVEQPLDETQLAFQMARA